MRWLRFLACVLLLGCAPSTSEVDLTPSNDGEEGEEYSDFTGDKTLGWDSGPLTFEAACAPGDRLTIAAVGDVLLHGRLQRQAFSSEHRYRSLWGEMEDLLQQADVAYANLEGPTAEGVNARGREVNDPGPTFDNVVYTSYPMFNYHPSLVEDLITSGVDVVSTANNHSLDRRALGANRTIGALEDQSLAFTGTRRSNSNDEAWHTITTNGDFRLAWLACTYGTNGIPDNDEQVLFCFRDRDKVLAQVETLSADGDIDAVIVTPHWGNEYQAFPNDAQKELAHDLLDAGALAVIGSHPHVLQPWELHETPDGREGFVIYSLGNFVSGQNHLPRRSTLLLYLGLTRLSDGRVAIHGVRYVPLHMSRIPGGTLSLQAIDRVGGLLASRDLALSMFGAYNLFAPADPLVLDPQCDPEWQAPAEPHPHDGWVGGSCDFDTACGGTECAEELPGGYCTEACSGLCPDRLGRVATFCIDLSLGDEGACVARCSNNADCRQGYECASRPRYGDSSATNQVCVPLSP